MYLSQLETGHRFRSPGVRGGAPARHRGPFGHFIEGRGAAEGAITLHAYVENDPVNLTIRWVSTRRRRRRRRTALINASPSTGTSEHRVEEAA